MRFLDINILFYKAMHRFKKNTGVKESYIGEIIESTIS